MLLATDANQITVVILCIAALVFVFIDIYLVYSLHKHNKRLAKRRKSAANKAELPPATEENEGSPTTLSYENVLSDINIENGDDI